MEDAAKVNVEDMVKNYKVANREAFKYYLKEVYDDLVQRSDDKKKGINKITFGVYYKLPGIIAERLFTVLNKKGNSYLDSDEFINGMTLLFCEGFDETSKFIFDFYDFDKDGSINKEDIRIVLSYVSLHNEDNKNEQPTQKYLAKVDSQQEIYNILHDCFDENQLKKMTYSDFTNIIKNKNSDIYFLILLFLYDKKPFSKAALLEYGKQKKVPKQAVQNAKQIESPSRVFVRRPNRTSTFSSCVNAMRATARRKTIQGGELPQINENIFQGRRREKTKTMATGIDYMMQMKNKLAQMGKNLAQFSPQKEQPDYESVEVQRKEVINLNQMDKEKEQDKEQKFDDVEILPAVKRSKISSKEVKKTHSNHSNSQENFPSFNGNQDNSAFSKRHSNPFNNYNPTDIINEESDKIFEFESDSDSNSFDDSNHIEDPDDKTVNTTEGYLYKLVDTPSVVPNKKQMKCLYFKLIHHDFYYFKQKIDKLHLGMHNLSGVFIEELPKYSFRGKIYYCFALIFPKKRREYYCENESEYKLWIEALKIATGYTNLTDLYDIGKKIGSGKFGLVKIGTNKKSGKKYAIKILSKKNMKAIDLELIRSEIEILKICQHPNIITLYDVFENVDYIYIIMEYCPGGDLFSYIESKGFRLAEKKACEIIHKICAAVFFIHSYGIVHRDLKPENILMTDKTENADIRILDFGLSKILSRGEKCTEQFGTLSYCAPEVLKGEPYDKEVDIWSIGIIAYLLLTGNLPFDHRSSEKEIARQTVNDPVNYKSKIWNIISPEAKGFVKRALTKDPKKRMNIKEALEDPWFDKILKIGIATKKGVVGNELKVYSATDSIV